MTSATDAAIPPNHHAHHPGFSGLSGLKAAVFFLFKRHEAAQLAIDLGELGAGDHLVDIGCGPGYAAALAAEAGADAIGVDPASVMLQVAKVRWLRRGIDWRIGTAEVVPVDAGWATVVWSLATVHHWHDIDRGLEEVGRLLAPGGRFVAIERQVDDPLAEGVAGHGWTPEQAEAFADACREHGLVDAVVSRHEAPGPVLAVVARHG